jgi:hypothetical protein
MGTVVLIYSGEPPRGALLEAGGMHGNGSHRLQVTLGILSEK